MPLTVYREGGVTILEYDTPEDRNTEAIRGHVHRVLTRGFIAHRDMCSHPEWFDPEAPGAESYREHLSRLAGEGLLGLDFRKCALERLTPDQIERILVFLVSPARIRTNW